jgi:transposase-like protein
MSRRSWAACCLPARRAKLRSTNRVKRVNGEIKRRAKVVGALPNEAAVVRLGGAMRLEQNDERATQRSRYMPLEAIALLRSIDSV